MGEDIQLRDRTRRHFFRDCGAGVAKIALANLVGQSLNAASLKQPHFAPRAKSVIYLFMAGGPSQLDLFEYKPELKKLDGQPAPDSFVKGKRFAFMDTSFNTNGLRILGTPREFRRHGGSGLYFSELLPHMAGVADELVMLHGVSTDNFNHGPAKTFINTGSVRTGRPAIGAWVTYGIGSESQDLPGFVVLQSGPRGPRGGAQLWSSGFLPTSFQGVPLRSAGDPILNLSNPPGVDAARQRAALDAIAGMNRMHREETGDPEIDTRIAAYEMAFRVQTSGPELIDFKSESAETLALYGAEPGKPTYANNCLLARRLVERGARFVQLYHTDWDHHDDLTKPLDAVCKDVDQATAALVKDLKRRGLLDTTLVIWGGEFGRTPMGEVREKNKIGRNHHIDAYSLWMAGGGIRPGQALGQTDEFGFSSVGQKIHIHDVQASILQLLGLDHSKLTYRFQGRDFRLTDVSGQVIPGLIG